MTSLPFPRVGIGPVILDISQLIRLRQKVAIVSCYAYKMGETHAFSLDDPADVTILLLKFH